MKFDEIIIHLSCLIMNKIDKRGGGGGGGE